MTGGSVRIARNDAVARVRLDRPAARNALDLQTCLDLRALFEELDGESSIRVILLSGEGPVFCAGADLKERKDRDEEWVRRRRLASFAAYAAVERCAKPVVAVVHGTAIGAGAELAMACDFIVAATDAAFRFPEPHWGTVGATQRLQRVVGKRTAKELLFTGRAMPAQEAHARGLVARLAPPESLPALADDVAAAIAEAPALAIRLTKQAVDLGGETDQDRGIRIEMAAVEHNLAAGDWRAGVDDFSRKIGKKSD